MLLVWEEWLVDKPVRILKAWLPTKYQDSTLVFPFPPQFSGLLT